MKYKLLFILLIFTFSCTNSCTKKTVLRSENVQEINNNNQTTINEDKPNIIGYITNNNLRIRNEPNSQSEILGILNTGDSVIINNTTDKKEVINNFENYWYNITAENNITGWVFGEYIIIIDNKIPQVFQNTNWHDFYGNLVPNKNLNVNDLISCSWQRYNTFLFFSNDGYYAKLGRADYPEYGKYTLQNNILIFFPPIKIIRFAEDYSLSKLMYSNDLFFEGSPVLINDDDTVVFTPHDAIRPKKGDMVKHYNHYCEVISDKGNVNINGYLYSLPDETSKNIFYNDYYGEKAKEIPAYKIAKTTINNKAWYYTLFDFTSGEPIDGGGPFYEGWLSEDYFE